MLKPFYQGKLDVFCAMYAVLNGLRLTHNVRTLKARDLLNETLLKLASKPAAFRAVLNQETDYVALVDSMLDDMGKKFPLQVIRPFKAADLPDVGRFWDVCRDWMNPNGVRASNRAIILRFSRFRQPDSQQAVVRHWTTVDAMDANIMHLFDSSHDADAIQNMGRDSVVTFARDLDEKHLFLMHTDTTRFLRLPF